MKLPDNLKKSPAGVIRQGEQQLVDVLDTVKDGFFIMDKDFIILYANKAYERLSSSKIKDSIGKSLWRVFPHVAYRTSPYWIHYHEVIEKQEHVSFVILNLKQLWIELNAYPTEEGGIAVFIRDITKRIHAEQALKDSEKRFRALALASSDMFFRLNADASEIYRLDGRHYKDGKGTKIENWTEKYIPEFEKERVDQEMQSAIKEKRFFQLEHQALQRGGRLGWSFSRAVPILDDKGNIVEWFGAVTDITDRKDSFRRTVEAEQRMKMLTEQRNALVKINRAKDEFVALASHQLRTPATAVKQYIGMLVDGYEGPMAEKQLRMLHAAYDSNERELKIIHDLLKTAQIDGSSSNLKAQPYDIIKLCDEVICDLEGPMEHRHQSFRFYHREDSVTLSLDITEIKLAITNLLENASKYSPRGSTIRVDVTADDTSVAVAVIDEGVGIDAEDQDKVFEKFSRVNNPLSDTVSGSGLGLYWVKRIAEIHRGTIELQSEPGKGSTFILRLPRSKRT